MIPRSVLTVVVSMLDGSVKITWLDVGTAMSVRVALNALSGSVFQGTRIALVKWFAMIVLLLNAKKSISCYQLARDLGLKLTLHWSMAHRLREAMVKEDVVLQGIVEADETFVGGKAKRWPDKELRTKRGVRK